MKTKKQAATKKKAPLAKAKKASKPASKKLLRFASGKSNRAPAVIVPELVDFEVMNFSNVNDEDEYEFDTGENSFSLTDQDEDEASFDNRSYYRYRNLTNPERP